MSETPQEIEAAKRTAEDDKRAKFEERYAKENLEYGKPGLSEAYVYNRRNTPVEFLIDLYETGPVTVIIQPHGVRRVAEWVARIMRRQGIEISHSVTEPEQIAIAVRWCTKSAERDDPEFGVPLDAPKPLESVYRTDDERANLSIRKMK